MLNQKKLQTLKDLLYENLHKKMETETGLLFKMINHQLKTSDSRNFSQINPTCFELPGIFSLLIEEICTGQIKKSYPIAESLELISNFLIVHEDVQNGNPERNGHPSVWWEWGPAQAINAGDALHVLAQQSLLKLGHSEMAQKTLIESVITIENACFNVFKGQQLEIEFQDKIDINTKQYLEMIELKISSLIECSMKLSSALCGLQANEVSALGIFGKYFAMSYQIQLEINSFHFDTIKDDDKLNEIGSFITKKKNFPIIWAIENSSPQIKRELGTLYFKRVLDKKDVLTIQKIIQDNDILEKINHFSDEYFQKGIDELINKNIDNNIIEKFQLFKNLLRKDATT